MQQWDIIVIGGGHAGCEAASAAGKMGLKTAMLTLNPTRIGFMSCNPAIGGLAKGQLVKEIDALGGVMGRITDQTAIQYRQLNSSKGPAVRSSRAQCDKAQYALKMQAYFRGLPGVEWVQAEAADLWVENAKVCGVVTRDGQKLRARAVIVTTGTFLRAVMHTGVDQSSGGRIGDQASQGLSKSISELGFRLRRLKTGTPPRLHKDSIDYGRVEAQPGDVDPVPFSFYYRGERFPELNQLNCFITYTNPQTHEIIAKNFDRSPLFTGQIEGIGPRYCPSIEDKVKRFSSRDRHQIFLEPEGWTTDEVYVNGMSTSLPKDVQEQFIHSIEGLERAEFTQFGYAVEYDAVDARQLSATFESKDILGLFFAGQINGTSGYEEAGAQGLIAGINAALYCQERDRFVLGRHEAYCGVLADDLVLKGTDEPYRMFTSRAEYRLLLREDNADLRLSEKARGLGLLNDDEWRMFTEKRDLIDKHSEGIKSFYFLPTEQVNASLAAFCFPPLKDRVSAEGLLKRPQVKWVDLVALGYNGASLPRAVSEQIEVQVKYEGYIARDLEALEGVREYESEGIPAGLDFEQIGGLSAEVRGRFREVRPETIGQAMRMVGVTPAAVASLVMHLKSRPKNLSQARG